MTPELETTYLVEGEIAHHYDLNGDCIYSTANSFRGSLNGRAFRFSIPQDAKHATLSKSRILRRLLRLDKSNAVFNCERDSVIVFYRGAGWRYDIGTGDLDHVMTFRQCRNALHQGVCVSRAGIFVGEYGSNPTRDGVPVWGSYDGGRSWRIVYEFPAGKVRHVHGVYSDPYTDDIWITTGDNDSESYLARTDPAFKSISFSGDGSQASRAVGLMFREDAIFWGMDSPLQDCYLLRMDRHSGQIVPVRRFEGPIWYTKTLEDGAQLLQTTVEVGPGVKSSDSHVYVSNDLLEWRRIASYRKDRWPMPYFKYGVIGFADGHQSRSDFVMFGEGLTGLDGRIVRACLR